MQALYEAKSFKTFLFLEKKNPLDSRDRSFQVLSLPFTCLSLSIQEIEIRKKALNAWNQLTSSLCFLIAQTVVKHEGKLHMGM